MKTRIFSLFFPILFLFSVSLSGQEVKRSFLNKTNQHSIDVQFASIGYSYAHKFKPNLTLGIGAHVGSGVQIILLASPILFNFGYSDDPGKLTPSGSSFEILKLQFFYRNAFSKYFYFDAGPFFSTVLNEAEWDNVYNAGIETTLNYMLWKINIGVRLRVAYSFDNPFDKVHYHPDKSYFALFLTPLVIGFNF